MSVIFHLISGEIEIVPFGLLTSSKVLQAVLSDLHLKEDVGLDVKPEFTEAFHFYVEVLLGHKPTITSVEELLQCLSIEDYYEDKDFLIYLIPQAYKFWSIVAPYLPDDDEVWLRTPYEFVPTNLRNQEKFFNDWLELNANKQVVLNDNEIYYTNLTYYDANKKQRKELDIYHTVSGEKVGYYFKVGWYANPSIQGGQVEYRQNYKDGKWDGLQEAWYADGQDQHRGNYKNGQKDGLWKGWYADGQAMYRDNYKDGKQDGLQERWYDNPKRQAMYRDNYKDGKQDGLWEAWYVDGQDKYRHIYKDGKLDGLQERWYADGQAMYRTNYKDSKQDGLQEYWYANGQREYVKEYGMGKLISEQQF